MPTTKYLALAATFLLSANAFAGGHDNPIRLVTRMEHRANQLVAEIQHHFGPAPCFPHVMNQALYLQGEICTVHSLIETGQVNEARHRARGLENLAERLEDIVDDIDDDYVDDDYLDRAEDLIGDIDSDAEDLADALKHYHPVFVHTPSVVVEPARVVYPPAPAGPPTIRRSGYPRTEVFYPKWEEEPTTQVITDPQPISAPRAPSAGPLLTDPRHGLGMAPGDEPYVEQGPVIRGRLR